MLHLAEGIQKGKKVDLRAVASRKRSLSWHRTPEKGDGERRRGKEKRKEGSGQGEI